MVKITIDKIELQVEEGTTILQAAKKAGIQIPVLCYMEGINEIGACRVCVVEVEGIDKLVAACNNPVRSGMRIVTNSPKVREARRKNVELILSQHDCLCATCIRSGNCTLQTIANDLGILELPFESDVPKNKWNKNLPLIRDDSKCIKCMRCIQVCDKIQNLGIWDIANTGLRTTVKVANGCTLDETGCTLCGQCITHCPVGALHERDDTAKVFKALADKDKITVVQIAPAVRAAWGESLGLEREKATVKRLVAALRKMGFNYIFDTDFSADLTIMEEGSEFLDKLQNKEKYNWPMFTSCCPGWIRFIKGEYPDMVNQLSTAKSPQQMFGSVAKSYYADLLNVDPEKIFSISIMPCVAKKAEAALDPMNSAGAGQDVDVVLTTREVDRMIRAEQIVPADLEEEEFDMPLGMSTGAAVIFGATGGVMEAALRSAYFLATGENPPIEAFENVRGRDGWREATYDVAGIPVRVAVASGLGNTRRLIEAIRAGKVDYDFVEIMACPGGCAGGGGQPIWDGKEMAEERAQNLYDLDANCEIRFSHENPAVQKLYADYMGKPLSHKSHKLLHTDHNAWKMPTENK